MRIDKAISDLAKQLSRAGIDTAGLDARLLVQHALGLSELDLVLRFDQNLDEEDLAHVRALSMRRLQHEPVAHILGEKEFWGLPFKVTKDTLVPRPDSEILVETILAKIQDQNQSFTIVDIGTGSGCLLLALLSELPNAYGVGLDISAAALAIARENAHCLGLDDRTGFVAGNYSDAVGAGADILISNPPYLAECELADLEVDVAGYDPVSALVSGPDGLEAYREIFSVIQSWDCKPLLMAFEFGYRQGSDLHDLAILSGFENAVVHKDLGNRDRVLLIES